MGRLRFDSSQNFAKSLDNNDALRNFRNRFYINEGSIYMCGNSLGLLSKDAEESTLNMLDKWKDCAVQIWNADKSKYYLYSQHLAELMAPLVGADSDEIAITGSTTSNIHQAVTTFYKPTQSRFKILVDDINFPTDRYAVDSIVRLKGLDPKSAVKVVKSFDGHFINEDDIISGMTDDVALVLLPGVFYRSAQIIDMNKVSEAARKRGIIIGWDLSHAIGSINIDLKTIEADFAVWCTYKYLNGGPGSSAGIYINRRHFTKLPGLAGWFGNKRETQFLLRQEFDHQQDANGWQIGTPTLMSMAALEGALKIVNEATIKEIRKKSLQLTAYLMFLIDELLSQYNFKIGNSRDDMKRGGHVCLVHVEAYRISIAMRQRGVVPDFRDPNMMRLSPSALYTSYEEVYSMVKIIIDIMETESYKDISLERNYVV